METYLLSGEIPLRFDEMVFALGKDGHVVLLNHRGVLPKLDQLQVNGVRLVLKRIQQTGARPV